MKTTLTFLTASVPLTKKFEMVDGVLVKHGNPKVTHLTSSTHEVTDLKEFHLVLSEMSKAPTAPCLFKGELIAPLKNESRRNMGQSNALTTYAILDFDSAPFATPDEAMKACGLNDVSYIWQYSSSARVTSRKTLHGHAFLMLSKPIPPHLLRSWFMYLNLRIDVFKKNIELSKAKQAVHWPLDVVVSDNNRMIYIAEPIFKGMKNPIPSVERVQLVKKVNDTLDVKRIPEHSYEALKKEERDVLNSLRVAEGLPPLRGKCKMVGEHEVQAGVGPVSSYEVIDNGDEFIRYNLNGGDSQAYWHPRNSFELLHSFKGEPSMHVKEVMPQRYAELCRGAGEAVATPNEDGDLLLAFRDKVLGSYWKGTWNPAQYKLELYKVGARIDLEDFMQSHGRSIGTFVPEWHMTFNPRSNDVINEPAHVINTFVPPPLMRGRENLSARKTTYPTIQKVLDSAVGTGLIQDHFLNWLACIVQYRCKTNTAWILHGTQGTGKGVLFNTIRHILSEQYIIQIRPDEVDSQFNSWLDRKLLVYCDEIEVDFFLNKSAAESRLKMSITESYMPIRLMRTDVKNTENFVNMIFGSNKTQPVQIPMNDRRFNVGVFQIHKLPMTRHEIDVVIPSEVEAFAYHLSTREADLDRAAHVLQTEDRAAIQSLGVTSAEEFTHDIIHGNLDKLWEYMPDEGAMSEHGLVNATATAYATLMKRFVKEDVSKISRDELQLLFAHAIGETKQGANKFTAYLRHRGITLKKMRFDDRVIVGMTTTWVITPEQRKELAESVTVRVSLPKLRVAKG